MVDARNSIVEGILVLALTLLLVPEPARRAATAGESGGSSLGLRAESPLVADAASGRGEGLRIRYVVSRRAQVAVGIFALSGRPVRRLARENAVAGAHTVTWDRRDESGRRVEPGVYYCRLSVGDDATRNTLLLVD